MEDNNKAVFNPTIFTAAITAGFMTFLPIFIFQFTIEHNQTLATHEAIWKLVPTHLIIFFYFLEFAMVACSTLCLILNKWFFYQWWRHLHLQKISDLWILPHHHLNIQYPFISILVLFYAIGPTLHYFFPLGGQFLIPIINGIVVLWAILFCSVFALQLLIWKYSQTAIPINAGASDLVLPHSAFSMALLAFISGEFTTAMPAESILQLPATLTLIASGAGIFLVLQQMLLLAVWSLRSPNANLRLWFMAPSIALLGIALFRIGHFQINLFNSNIGNFSYLIAGITYGLVVFFWPLAALAFPRSQLPKISAHQWATIWPLISFILIGCLVHKFLFSNIVFYSFILFCLLCSILIFGEIFWLQWRGARKRGIKIWALE